MPVNVEEPPYITELRRPPAARKGRNVQDGYARGVGLQFGTLAEAIRRDPIHVEAVRLAHGRTIVSEHNRMNMFLILRAYLDSVPGHVIEFGTYKGGNAIFMASVLKRLCPERKVYGLDTFTGMPDTDAAVDAHRRGDFQDVDLEEMRNFVAKKGLDNLELVQGMFQETAEVVLREAGQCAVAHIDCDIYSAVAYSYEVVKPYMAPGGYIVFDDACFSSCLGATEAVEELLIRRDGLHCEQIYPQFVFRANLQAV